MTDDTNTRVTNAILKVKIEHLDKKLDKAISRWDKHMEESANVKTCMAVLKRDVDELNKRTQKWDIANSALGLLLASVLAYFGLRAQ